jgi:predicted transcriptional regulator
LCVLDSIREPNYYTKDDAGDIVAIGDNNVSIHLLQNKYIIIEQQHNQKIYDISNLSETDSSKILEHCYMSEKYISIGHDNALQELFNVFASKSSIANYVHQNINLILKDPLNFLVQSKQHGLISDYTIEHIRELVRQFVNINQPYETENNINIEVSEV